MVIVNQFKTLYEFSNQKHEAEQSNPVTPSNMVTHQDLFLLLLVHQ